MKIIIIFTLLFGGSIISNDIFQKLNITENVSLNEKYSKSPNPKEAKVYYENTSGRAYDAYVSGNYVYVADGSSGLAIIDISDPTNPGIPIYEDTSGIAYGVHVSGNYAYMADGSSGLVVIDISDPTNPGTPVYKTTSGFGLGIYVSGNYVYLANSDSGLAIIDISDPTNPGTPIYEDTDDYAYDVWIDGDYAYVADRDSGLAIIDILDPTNPGTPVYEDTTGDARGVYVSGDFAYVADAFYGLVIINISDPTNPGTPIYEDTDDYAYDVWIDGDYAYVADRDSGLAVIDISDPTNPGTPMYEDTSDIALTVHVSGNYAYVADYYSGLAVIEISRSIIPGMPVYEEILDYNEALGLDISGDYVYVATSHHSNAGMAVIDVSDPTNPEKVAFKATPYRMHDVYVSGDYAYLAGGEGFDGKLAVIDISDPTNPGTPIYETISHGAYDVYVSGDYAYLAYDDGLVVIDISDPTDPGTPIYEGTSYYAFGVYVSGDYAYLACGYASDGKLAIIDISDPTNSGTPVYQDLSGVANDVYVSGDYAYVADGNAGLAIVNISDPTNPGTPVYEGTSGTANGIYVSGDDAYLATSQGLAVIDISDPANPGSPIYQSTIGRIADAYICGDYAYMSVVESVPPLWTSYLTVIQVRKRIDMEDPIIIDTPTDLTVEYGYTGQSLSWTASDPNPSTYIIELEGTGIVTGPTAWTSGVTIIYNISDGFVVGDYIFTINFTDEEGNYAIDSVTFTVEDTTNPVITDAPTDLTVEYGYTGQSLSWTASDPNPSTYIIELEGTGIVAGPIAWTSGIAITYDIPDGFVMGDFVYTVNFTDEGGNYAIDSVTFTVEDTTNPVITDAPTDLTVEYGYTGQSFSWTATDANPTTYTIELQGSGIVTGPTAWTSSIAITYDIPDGLAVGIYVYIVNFTDEGGNYATDIVAFTVEDTTNPVISDAPSDLVVEYGYTGQNFSWTATDANPTTYTITLEGTGIVVGPTAWTSGIAITYDIPDGFAVGDYVYTVKFTDSEGNYATNNVTFTVEASKTQTVKFPIIPVIIGSMIGIVGAGIAVFVWLKKRAGREIQS